MEIILYQINSDRDYEDCEFMGFDYAQEHGGIDPSSYDRVWSGYLEATTLEGVYSALNRDIRPDNYNGRSVSISDVCQIVGADGDSKFYFVDRMGFKEVEFDISLTREAKEREITCVACYPGKTAQVIKLPNTLKAKQDFVGGYIEAVYPFSDPVAIICNEEGKINGLLPNRALYDEDGKMFDIVSGPMLVVGLTEDDFGSLRGELLEKYLDMYKMPEVFVRMGKDVLAFKIPEKQENVEKIQNHIRHK